ncbi:hypothetical protein [Nonomuraea basaltis]|uniref:hypothetical protein n=1 Tax=Nonomuraea basaltis TaxID=2495887 RepID=UPI00110C4174|nr:hypothetical protein [Nonomuraea basaltis]TMR89908.1 hypothetical protein EJK15_58180 [Nonomuraea basaltis]
MFGSLVGLFLLAVGAFFLAGGDHGGGDGGAGHGAGNANPGAVEGAAAPDIQFLDLRADGQVRTTDFTLEATEPDDAGPDTRGTDHEPTRGGHR